MLALLIANLPVLAVVVGGLALALHYRWRRPATCRLLIVSPGGRFALPAEGRFGMGLTDRTSMGGIWIELRFRDRPDAALTLLRDQFTESDWRRLRLVLKEGY